MIYCSNCGGRLNDQGLCPNCGGMSESTVRPRQKTDSEVLRCLTGLFSASPLTGVEAAARTRSASVWVTFGAAYMIASASAAFSAIVAAPVGFVSSLCGKDVGEAVERARSAASDSMSLSFTGLMGHAAVMSLLSVIMAAVIAGVLFLRAEERPTVTQALNIAAFSLLPMTIGLLIAVPLMLFAPVSALQLLVFCLAVSVVLFYFGVQKASFFTGSPFLLFLLASLLGVTLLRLCSFGIKLLLF